MHQPLWADPNAYDPEKTGWGKVQTLLASRPHTVFAGHWHTYAASKIGGRDYVRLSVTGGASEVRGIEAARWTTSCG